MEKTIKFLEKQIEEIEEELTSLAEKQHMKQMDLLTSIKGIGATLAAALIIATGGFTYFDHAKQLTRYLGLPTYQQSGTSVNVKWHMNRNGDAYLHSKLNIGTMASLLCNTKAKLTLPACDQMGNLRNCLLSLLPTNSSDKLSLLLQMKRNI